MAAMVHDIHDIHSIHGIHDLSCISLAMRKCDQSISKTRRFLTRHVNSFFKIC